MSQLSLDQAVSQFFGLQDILEATASEPLTLAEEYTMQQTWRTSGDKLTFIICKPFQLGHLVPSNETQILDQCISIDGAGTCRQDEIEAMIGDVNLFISLLGDDVYDDDDSHRYETAAINNGVVGELEIMIAEHARQGKGNGKAALLLFLTYIIRNEAQILDEFHRHAKNALDDEQSSSIARIAHFSVKIGQANARSIALFEGLGFMKTTGKANYFGEFELRLGRDAAEKLVGDDFKVMEYRCACETAAE